MSRSELAYSGRRESLLWTYASLTIIKRLGLPSFTLPFGILSRTKVTMFSMSKARKYNVPIEASVRPDDRKKERTYRRAAATWSMLVGNLGYRGSSSTCPQFLSR